MSDVGDDLVPPLREHPVVGLDDREGGSVIRLAGELDLYNAGDFRAALDQAIAAAPRCIVIDLTLVEFVDSTALGVLIEARSRLGQDGLRLAAPQLETRRTLQVSGLDRHLTVHDTVDEALLA
jgi:anti-anti-sigma factor